MEHLQNKHLMIIEDDDFLRTLAVTKLEKSGCKVTTAADGKSGFDKITSEKPDLLILDLMLPTMSGFEVLTAIRKQYTTKELPVLVFSNLGEESDMQKCLDLGISDYMIKANFTLDELVEKVTTLLSK